MSNIPKFISDQSLIEFDEKNHIYKFNNQELVSVTTFISSFSDGFDKDGSILAKSAAKKGISEKKLKKEWMEKGSKAAKLGTFFHQSIEHFFKTGEIKKNKFTDIIQTFARNFNFKGQLISECRIFSPELGLCGTSDLVRLIDNTIDIFDFKVTEKKIDDFAFGRKYNPPISYLNDSKLNKYTLQLSMYAYILNLEYGLEIGNSHSLFRIDPKKREIERIPIELKLHEVISMLSDWTYKKSLEKNQ